MKIQAIALDLDGVLVDACELHREVLNEALVACGQPPISEEEHRRTFNGLPTRLKLRMMGFTDGEIQKVNEEKQRRTLSAIDRMIRPDPRMVAKVSALHDRYPLACVSNSVRASVDRFLDRAGLLPFLELTISNEDVSKPKPDPEGYQKAAVELGFAPREILVLEDNKNGREAAVLAGCRLCPVEDPSWTLGYVLSQIEAHDRVLELPLLPAA